MHTLHANLIHTFYSCRDDVFRGWAQNHFSLQLCIEMWAKKTEVHETTMWKCYNNMTKGFIRTSGWPSYCATSDSEIGSKALPQMGAVQWHTLSATAKVWLAGLKALLPDRWKIYSSQKWCGFNFSGSWKPSYLACVPPWEWELTWCL